MRNNCFPKIRFREFTGTWKQYRFGLLYDIVSGYAFKQKDYIKEGVPIINGEAIQHNEISGKRLNFLPFKFLESHPNAILRTGDIVLGLNRPIINGQLKIAQISKELDGALLYQRAGKIEFLNNSDRNFSYQLLMNEVSKFVVKEAVGSDQPFISTSKIKNWLIVIPTIENEKKKIGSFFKHLDSIIIHQQQELDTLKQTKQGFLQKMFPQEGESVPELRFPGLTEGWRQFKLGEIIEISSASRVHKNEWTTSGVRFFRSSDVVSKFNRKKNKPAFISFDLYNELSEKSGVVKPGDMLVTGGGSIGIPYLIKDLEPLYFKDADLLWFKSASKIDGHFLYSYFVTTQLSKYISSITHIGTISHYTIEQAKGTPIKLPEYSEQIQIGNFFKQLDEVIALQQQELDALKQTKKAFLQKMFV